MIQRMTSLLARATALPAAALLTLLACAPTLAQQPAAAPADLLYVCVQDDAAIAVIDMATHTVVRTIDLKALGYSANAKPHHIAVEPDGHWYVSLIGENRVVRFDAEGNVLGHYEMETPGMLAYDGARRTLMASRSMSAVNPPARVSVIPAGSMDGEQIDVFFPRPHPMVVTHDGRWAYTGSLGVNQLAAIDLETEEVTLTSIEGPPHSLVQFALSPDGRTLVAATELTGRLLAFDRSAPEHPKQIASVELGPMAFDPIYSPDGASVWVPVKGANQVAIVDPATWTVKRRIEGRGLLQPHAIVFSRDGRLAYVSNNNKSDHMAGHEGHGADNGGKGNVTVIDTKTFEIIDVIDLGMNVTGMGARPAH